MASCYNTGRCSMATLAANAPLDFHHLSTQEPLHTWKVIDLHTDQTYYLHRVGTTFERFKSLKALNRSRDPQNKAPLSRKGARFYTFQKGWFYSSLNPVNKRQFKQFIRIQQNQQSRLQAIKAAGLGLLATLHGTGGFSSSSGHTAVGLLSASTHAVSTLRVPLLAAGVLSTALPTAAATTTTPNVMTTTAAPFFPGMEFRINTYTTLAQSSPSLAALQDGGFVVAWHSLGQDGDAFGVYGQRFNALGQKAGAEFPINTYTTSQQTQPNVAALQDGGFVVTWHSDGQDGDSYGIYGQRFDALGQRVGAEFLINTYTISSQSSPIVAAFQDGGFVVTWQSNGQDGSSLGVYGQRFDASGQKAGVEFPINTYTTFEQSSQDVTTLKDGGFVVAWQSQNQDGDGYGVYGQRFDASGQTAGAEFSINTYTTSHQQAPSLTALQDGGFIVTWTSPGQDGDSFGIYAQRFDASGQKTGAEFLINTYTTSGQFESSVTALKDGGFVVAWISNGQDGDGYGIYGQRFDATDQKIGMEFLINTYTTSHQQSPSLTALKDGGFVVTWQSFEQDGSREGIYGRIFSLNQALGTTTIPVTIPATNPVTTKLITTTTASIKLVTTTTASNKLVTTTTKSNKLVTTTAASGVETTSAAPLFAGLEFPVSTYTFNQAAPSVTPLQDGGFFVTWQSTEQDGSNNIYGQRFDSIGQKVDMQFRINTYTNSDQLNPSVTTLKDGSFVVTWQSSGQDGSGDGVYGQRFDASVQKVGAEFSINAYTPSNQVAPSLAALQYGGFVVTWQSFRQDGDGSGVYGQLFDYLGQKVGVEFSVNTYTTNIQSEPRVTALQDGGFVVTWQSTGQDGSGDGIYGQRFNSSLQKVGTEFLINTYTHSDQRNPSVTTLQDGGFVVTWASYEQKSTFVYDIYGQRFDAAGTKVGTEFHINTYTASNQPCVAALQDGGFVVTWTSNGQDGSNNIYGQRFDSIGQKVGLEFPINIYKTSSQISPSVAALKDGRFVVTWQSFGQNGGNYFSIYGRIFSTNPLLDTVTTPFTPSTTGPIELRTNNNNAALYAGVSAAVAALACSLFGALAVCFVLRQRGKKEGVDEKEVTQTIPMESISNTQSLPQTDPNGSLATVERDSSFQSGRNSSNYGTAPKQERISVYDIPPGARTSADYGALLQQPYDRAPKNGKVPQQNVEAAYDRPPGAKTDEYGAPPQKGGGAADPHYQQLELSENKNSSGSSPYATPQTWLDKEAAGAAGAKTYDDAPSQRGGGAADQPYQQVGLSENKNSSGSSPYATPQTWLDKEAAGAAARTYYDAPSQKES